MSKKKKAPQTEVSSENPEQEEIKVSWFDKIPFWIKAVVVKYWMYGIFFYFFNMGLFALIGVSDATGWGHTLVYVGACALLNPLLTYNILDILEFRKKQADPYMFWHSNKYYAFLVNMVLCGAVAFGAAQLCSCFVLAINSTGTENEFLLYLFGEPFTVALVSLAVDMAACGVKDFFVYVVFRRQIDKESNRL